MPKTREEIWAKAREEKPSDHLDRALKTIKDIRKELEDASRQQSRVSEGSRDKKAD